MAKKHTLENVLKQKLREPKIIYLLGAGASFCAGLPGTFQLTELVRSQLQNMPRSTFEETIRSLTNSGVENPSIEEILSELCHRLSALALAHHDKERLEMTLEAICQSIRSTLKVDGPTECHKEFVCRLVSRREAEPAGKAPPVQIFTTNYDLLIELACEESGLVAVNGFEGTFCRRWSPGCFDYDIGRATAHAKTPRFEPAARYIRLYKLHGSLSWFEDNGEFREEKPSSGTERAPLIIYPSRLKYAESIRPPFDWLFRKFGAAVSGAKLLVSIGYGFGDDTLNQYIFAGLDSRLSVLVLSKEPIDALAKKSTHPRVSMINEESTIIDGKDRNVTIDLWAFERFAKWLPALKEK